MPQTCENIKTGFNNLLLVIGTSLVHMRIFVKEINGCIVYI
jgi:hypothetical protein